MLTNKLFKATALSLGLTAATISGAWASSYGSMRTTHIMGGNAYPRSGQVRWATHQFRLHVAKQDLNEMMITFPSGVRTIREIEVRDDQNKVLKTNISVNEKEAKVIFASPVSADTILSVRLQGVNTNQIASIYQYRISGKLDNFSAFFPLGIARIHTYRD